VGLASWAAGERRALAQETVCAAGATLQGVDVSVYDGNVDWAALKSSGRVFGIAKATEGSTLTDGEFATNWPAMKSAGITRSAYHFFHCDTDPGAEASFFLGVMGPLEPGDLPPSLDFEDTTTCTPATGVAMAITWLDAVASATGTTPILYTSVRVLSSFDGTAAFAGHAQLWVASRGVTCPSLPSPFTAWSFWQYSLTGTAPGLPNSNGMADLDELDGDMTTLMGLTLGGGGREDGGTTSSSGSSASGPACTVLGVAGTCIDTSVCAAMPGYASTPGFCPGPADEECCTSMGGTSTSESTGGASTTGASTGGASSRARASADGGATTASSTAERSAESRNASSASRSGGGSSASPGASGGCAAASTTRAARSPAVAFLVLAGVALSRRRRRAAVSG